MEAKILNDFQQYIYDNYNRHLFFTARRFVSEWLNCKGSFRDHPDYRSLSTQAATVIKQLLKEKRIARYSNKVWKVIR